MVFSFNFAGSEVEGGERGKKRALEVEEGVAWCGAGELRLQPDHLAALGLQLDACRMPPPIAVALPEDLTSIEHFDLDDETSINFVNSASVGSRLLAKG
jgi:hypothetical protein